MSTGFENVPTGQLARETLLRAEDVDDVNDAVWAALPWAFGGLAGGMMVGMNLNVFYDWSFGWSMALAIIIGVWPLWRWVVAGKRCDAYTREMRRRSKELRNRNNRTN